MLFVDSNVILDVITADPHWAAWSATQLAQTLAPALKPGVSPRPGMQQEQRGLP
jgi:hypothetical protein